MAKKTEIAALFARQMLTGQPGDPVATFEHRFHSTRRWRFDVAFIEAKLAIEIEGGTWRTSRHTSGAGFEKDCIKYANAMLLGWRVLRVTTSMVKNGTAASYARELLGS